MNWPGSMKLKPETASEISETGTVQGKRKRLNEYAFRGNNPMVKAVMDAGRYQGLSGEDIMTWLAYEALLNVEHLQDTLLNHINTTVSTRLIVDPPAGAKIERSEG